MNWKKVIIDLLYLDVVFFMFWSFWTIFFVMEFTKQNLIIILFINVFMILVYKTMRLKLGFKEECLLI